MIEVKFFGNIPGWFMFGYSEVEEDIESIKVDVVELFKKKYPDSKNETNLIEDEEEFQFIFSGQWKNPNDIDEDVIKKICDEHELNCSILEKGKSKKSYYHDEGDMFVYD